MEFLKSFSVLFILVMLLFNSTASNAAPAPVTTTNSVLLHEIVGNTSGSFTLQSGENTLQAELGYFYTLGSAFQLGGKGTLVNTSGSGSTYVLTLGGIRINFPTETFQDSLFFGSYLGVRHLSGGLINATGFVYSFDFGKRISIVKNVTYSPAIEIVKIEGDDVYIDFKIIAFSFLF